MCSSDLYAISGYLLWGWRAVHGQPAGVAKARAGGNGAGSGS